MYKGTQSVLLCTTVNQRSKEVTQTQQQNPEYDDVDDDDEEVMLNVLRCQLTY